MQWAPVPPTAVGAGAPTPQPYAEAPGAGVSPTVPGQPPASAPGWSSGMYQGPQPTQAPESLAPYRLDGQLPLPPAVGSPYGGAGHTAPPGGAPGPMMPMPPSMSYPEAQPARGGIVFVIIGLSAFVAVMILLVVWALFLRG